MAKSLKNRKKSILSTRSITPNLLLRVRDKFVLKGWEIEVGHDNSSFQRYCSMIAGLMNDEQENFVFELTDRFITVEDSDYERYIFFSIKNILRNINCKTIYVIPMISPEDIGYSIKSSGRVAYLLKGKKIKTLREYNQQNIKLYENIKNMPDELRDDDVILLVDDFVGSGDTALKAINHIYFTKPNFKNSKIIILCIASLKTGFDLIESIGIDVYATIILDKAISDYYTNHEKENYLDLMNQIEEKIKVPIGYKLGYKKSEAIISLIRTPNNTLPIFWYDNKISKAPFPR